MNYRDTLHAIETTTDLEIIGIGHEPKGAYVALPCPNKCEGSAVMKTYGDKKWLGLPFHNKLDKGPRTSII